MAKAQQKPKKVSGTRNSDRRNGKAWKQDREPKKPTGRTILGYSVKRFTAMAAAKGMTVEALKAEMVIERDRKRAVTKANRAAFAALVKGADKLYRDGTLKHGPTPVLNRGKSE